MMIVRTMLPWIATLIITLIAFTATESFVISSGSTRPRSTSSSGSSINFPNSWPSSSSLASTSAGSSSSSSSSSSTAETKPSSSPDTNIEITIPPFLDDTTIEDGEQIDDYPSQLHKLYVRSVLTDEQAQTILQYATDYAKETGRWSFPDSLRHSSYPTCDFPVLEENDGCPTIRAYLKEIGFDTKLFGMMSELYDIDVTDLMYLDLFIAHYQAKKTSEEDVIRSKIDDIINPNIIDRLELHRDGSLLSFSLLLNDPDQFEGGGTYYDALRTDSFHKNNQAENNVLYDGGAIRPRRAGDAVLHCGKILHGADTVTAGNRTVLIGFVEVDERCIRPGTLAEACKEFGRMDVAKYRGDVQDRNLNCGRMLTRNDKWLRGSQSTIKGMYVPALSGIQRRSDPHFHRMHRLQAEDKLLRSILLPREERQDIEPWYGDDISIVD